MPDEPRRPLGMPGEAARGVERLEREVGSAHVGTPDAEEPRAPDWSEDTTGAEEPPD